jgi:hypothetical protein
MRSCALPHILNYKYFPFRLADYGRTDWSRRSEAILTQLDRNHTRNIKLSYGSTKRNLAGLEPDLVSIKPSARMIGQLAQFGTLERRRGRIRSNSGKRGFGIERSVAADVQPEMGFRFRSR